MVLIARQSVSVKPMIAVLTVVQSGKWWYFLNESGWYGREEKQERKAVGGAGDARWVNKAEEAACLDFSRGAMNTHLCHFPHTYLIGSLWS